MKGIKKKERAPKATNGNRPRSPLKITWREIVRKPKNRRENRLKRTTTRRKPREMKKSASSEVRKLLTYAKATKILSWR